MSIENNSMMDYWNKYTRTRDQRMNVGLFLAMLFSGFLLALGILIGNIVLKIVGTMLLILLGIASFIFLAICFANWVESGSKN